MTSAFQSPLNGAEVPVKLRPDGSVPVTATGNSVLVDSTGAAIAPDAWSHAYGYDGSGNLITDTATDGTSTWIKTYTYVSGNLATQSKWVKQ